MKLISQLRNGLVMGNRKSRGFTLIELMIVVVILGLLASVALPSYRNYIIRSARVAAQGELLELAGMQEKIFLNSNSYAYGALGVTNSYDGTSVQKPLTGGGGLGRTSGQTKDARYALTLLADTTCNAKAGATVAGAQTYVLMATPIAGTAQAGDGNICITETGARIWGTGTW